MNNKICQSCGMPITAKDQFGTEKDGTKSQDYCKYCYKDGDFIDKTTMRKYIDMCSQYGKQAGMTNTEMKAYCEKLFPTLKRWKKDFNARMNNSKDMPKIIELDDTAAKKWGGKTMVVAPPIEYDKLMKKVPKGKLITTNILREKIAKNHNVEITCPLTCGIFVNICAWASYQRKEDITPFWRTLKSDGELNIKYPEGIELQKQLLETEGYTIITKGSKNPKYYVKNFEDYLLKL